MSNLIKLSVAVASNKIEIITVNSTEVKLSGSCPLSFNLVLVPGFHIFTLAKYSLKTVKQSKLFSKL